MRTEIQPLPDPGADPSYNIQHMGDCVIFRMQIVYYILYMYLIISEVSSVNFSQPIV